MSRPAIDQETFLKASGLVMEYRKTFAPHTAKALAAHAGGKTLVVTKEWSEKNKAFVEGGRTLHKTIEELMATKGLTAKDFYNEFQSRMPK